MRGYSSTSRSTSTAAWNTARKVKLVVVPTCSTHAHETLLWASKSRDASHTFNYDLINSQDPGSQLSSVWRIPAVPRREKSHGRHPTQKPLRLVRRTVLAATAEGELVFDPFCGSGTTGVAAKELGRFFVGAETERGYAELAGLRIGVVERGAVLEEIQAVGGSNLKRGRQAIGVKQCEAGLDAT